MSLFKLKELWSVQCSKTQQFDASHLAVGSLGFQPIIAVGSFSGVVRIYKPSQQYRQTDLLYQNNFKEPIVQVRVGVFINTFGNSLGILFVKKLLIINFNKTATNTLIANKTQEFPLSYPCFSFQPNPLFVVSLNNQLHYLNPPSKVLMKVSQSIYPINISKSNSLYYMDSQQLVKANSNSQQWRVLVGQVLTIHLFQKRNSVQIICVGDKCYWSISDDGSILESKLIQNEISCSQIVSLKTGYNILIGTFSQHLLIYQQSKLIWAAKCEFIPINIKLIQIKGQQGFLTLLSDTGNLDVCYLGTDAPIQSLQNQSKQINLKQIDKDINRLQQLLEQKGGSNQGNKKSTKNGLLKIQVFETIVQQSGDYVEGQQKLFQINNQIRRLKIKFRLESNVYRLSDIKLLVQLPENLYIQSETIVIDQLIAHSIEKQFYIYAYNDKFCYTDTFRISVTASAELTKGKQSQILMIYSQSKIPLNFQCIRVPTLKVEKAAHKVILTADKQIPNFSSLFNDVKLFDNSNANNTQITFKLSSGNQTSIIASKSSSKYKIQSDYYEGICLILIEFIKRVNKLKIGLSIESVPLQELFIITQSHYVCRKKLKELSKSLEQRSLQFRMIQKRILAKLKEKSSQLNSLDYVLQQSYKILLQQCNKFQQTQQQLSTLNHQLLISVKIVTQLLFLRGKTSEKGRNTINGILQVSKNGKYSQNFGWQEQVVVNSSVLLKKKILSNELQEIEYDRIKKILMWLVDRTAKGQIN